MSELYEGLLIGAAVFLGWAGIEYVVFMLFC